MQALNTFLKKHWVLFLIVPAIPLFFIGGPSTESIPWLKHAWNLGHTLFFFVATITYYRYRPFQSQTSVFLFLGILVGLSFVIEISQSYIGRNFSSIDVRRNLTGAALAVLVVKRPLLHPSLVGIFSLVFLLDLSGLFFKLYSEYQIQNRAPIIEDFEKLTSLSRWSEGTDFQVESESPSNIVGYKLLQPSKYSGIGMDFLLRDWSSFKSLLMDVYIPEGQSRLLAIRVHDNQHNNQYSDRFNTSVQIEPGWNRIIIPLSKIRYAPKTRELNMQNIANLGVFFIDLEKPMVFKLDNILLSDQPIENIVVSKKVN